MRHSRKIIKVIWLGVLSILIFCTGLVFGGKSTFARSQIDIQKSLADKVVYQGIYRCYTGGFIKSDIELKDYNGVNTFLASKDSGGNYVPLITGSGEKSFFGASWGNPKLRYDIADNGLSCKELFTGYNGFGGVSVSLLESLNHPAPPKSATEEIKTFVEGMGYSVTNSGGSGGGKSCYAIHFFEGSKDAGYSNSACVDSDGNYSVDLEGDVTANYFKMDGKKLCFVHVERADGTGGYRESKICSQAGDGLSNQTALKMASDACGSTQCETWYVQFPGHDDGKLVLTIDGSSDDAVLSQDSLGAYQASFINNSAENAGYHALNFLSGGTQFDADSIKIDEAEKRILYQAYLQSYYNVEINCDENVSIGIWGDDTIAWFDSGTGTMKQCHYRKNTAGDHKVKHANDAVNGVGSDGFMAYKSIKGVDEMIAAVKALPENYDDEDLGRMSEIVSGEMEENGEPDPDDCKNSHGAGSLGWIVCPLLKWMSDAAAGIYNDYVEPSLQVEPALFNAKGGDNVRTAWETFRDIANVLFIILFMFVIFSQLTGIGIDNYGIKKILPKLIVAAVMINLSYLICTLLIDLSNILGTGLKGIFDSLGAGLKPVVDFSAEGGDVGSAGNISGTLASVGVLVAVGVMVGAIWANPAILLALVVSAVSVIVAMFFLFLLLAARKAAVIVLTVLAPIAVVAYTLPNTKKLFDKWWKFFEGLLLVYPIAGLLIGGGNYISRLLLGTSTGFFTALTAMVVGIIPIFFIPTVLKSAFAAMGKLGGMLSGIGASVSSKAGRAVGESNVVKGLQQRGLQRQTRIRAGIGADGKPIKMTKFGRFMRGGGRNISAARTQYRRDRGELAMQQELLDDDLYGQRLESDEKARAFKGFQEQFSGMGQAELRSTANSAATWFRPGDSSSEQKMKALIGSMNANGMEKDVFNMLRNNGSIGNSADVMSELANSNNKVMKAYGKTGFGVSYTDFMNGTAYRDADGNITEHAVDSATGLANTSVSMRKYAEDKAGDFNNGLDDKALAEIRQHSNAGNEIMSTDQVMSAARTMKDNDSLNELHSMMRTRKDVKFSANDFVEYDDSTVNVLESMRSTGDASVSASMASAADSIANSPELAAKMRDNRKLYLNNTFRIPRGKSEIE